MPLQRRRFKHWGAGGVTSGIDFAPRIVAAIAGDEVAQSIQPGIEYDPEPPFRSGHPDRAPESIRQRVSDAFVAKRKPYEAALRP